MKASVHNVIIDRDMVLKPSKKIWAWELPVLQEKYGDDRVRLLDEVEIEVDELPDAVSEFSRLGVAHGSPGGDMTYVELAYGRGKAGIKALEDKLQGGAKVKKTKPRKKKAAIKNAAPAPVGEAEGDPLAI